MRSYFKFENWWLQTEGFLDRIKEWWRSFDCEGRPDFILAFQLKTLKIELRECSKSAQGNLALQKENIVNQFAEFEEVQDQRALGEEEIHSKAKLLLRVWRLHGDRDQGLVG